MTVNKKSMNPDWIDPDDAPDLSTPEWQAKFAQAKAKRGRPKSKSPKVLVTLRMEQDVLNDYKAMGAGWQMRMQEVLQKGRPRRAAAKAAASPSASLKRDRKQA